MTIEDEARWYFGQHYNCAQSTFAPFAKRMGLDLNTAFKIATPFGGGMGHMGQVCGAVSGGLMGIGLIEGITEYDKSRKYACYALAKALQDQIAELHGSVICPALLGLDIGDPDQLTQAREKDLFHTRCPQFVGDAARITAELLGMED